MKFGDFCFDSFGYVFDPDVGEAVGGSFGDGYAADGTGVVVHVN